MIKYYETLEWLYQHEYEDSLPEYSEITTLDYSGTAIEQIYNFNELPFSIIKMSNLERLEAASCTLLRIPSRIGYLKKLKYLDIRGNIIKKLPDSLCQCINLEELNISENQISELPDNIGNLQNLQELYMTNTEISSLPESFGKLKKLKKLNMYNTFIDEFPKSFFKLENLEDLVIHFYKKDITDNLLELPNLKEIHLTYWQLEHYPKLREKLESKGIEIITDID